VIRVYDAAGNVIETHEHVPSLHRESLIQVQQAQFTLRKARIGKPFRTWTPNINKKGIKNETITDSDGRCSLDCLAFLRRISGLWW